MNDAIRDVMIALAAMTDDGCERRKTPWSRGYWSYATDGKMAIRTTRMDEFIERGENDGTADAVDSLTAAATGPTWYDVPAVPPEPGPCPKCHGVPSVKCEACDGAGHVAWEFRHRGRTYDSVEDCPVCDGAGTVECTECGGTGKGDDPAVEVGPALIRAEYLRLLARLPGCRLAPVDGRSVIVFRFAGGAGAVMPVWR
ncbi:MAG: hypothetical protein GX595_18325 [Lentisphaerae bacterium]|nr:hypothetical protein [Lentisphaerota bacterium]